MPVLALMHGMHATLVWAAHPTICPRVAPSPAMVLPVELRWHTHRVPVIHHAIIINLI